MPPKCTDLCCRPYYLSVRIIPLISCQSLQELAASGTLSASLQDDIEMQASLATQNEILSVIKSQHLEHLFEIICLETRVLDQYCNLQCWFEKKLKISILLQTALSYVSNGDQVIFICPHQFKAVPFPVEGMI